MARVLLISPNPASNSAGGVERFCHLVAATLQASHDVRLAGPTRLASKWAMRFGVSPLLESASIPMRDGKWKPQVLITNGFLGGIRRPAHVPVVHVFHGTMVGHALNVGRGEPLRQRLRGAIGGGLAETAAARRALNVAVSESAASEARMFYRSRIDRVIPNGVDTAIFKRGSRKSARRILGLAESQRIALFVGRAEPLKGPEIARESCRRAGFDLVVAGPRPIPGAHNLGTLEPKRLALVYAAADCVVFPTRYEACSFVVLEALASGVPLVTTSVGWMPTLLRHVPSYSKLVAQPDVANFSEVLQLVREDPLSETVDAAYDWARANCSLEVFARQWRELIGAVLDGRPQPFEPSVRAVAVPEATR